jgi:hypothetical protein
MKIKKKKLDIVFSQLVRERANFLCQGCGAYKRLEQATLDCAHIMSRRSLGLRFHPRNAVSLCRGCHMFYTERPFDWNDWCIDHFGADFIAELRLVSNQTVKWSKPVREEIYKFYKEELKSMQEKRKHTELMIDFEQHEIMHVFGE